MATAIQATSRRTARERSASEPNALRGVAVGPLLVATDASVAADAAIRAAQAIVAHTGQRVSLLAVLKTIPIVSPEVQLAESPTPASRAVLRDRVREQLKRLSVDPKWPLMVMSGDPSATIVNEAKRHGAALVIMGLGAHGLFDRVIGDETVLRVLRLGTVPVLAVSPNFTTLPANVLAAVDFSPSSARAVSLAKRVMSHGGKLTLAHVVSSDLDEGNWLRSNAGYHGSVGRAFDLLVASTGFGDTDAIERKMLSGDPAKVLLACAEQVEPDLIVAGSHGYGFLSRLLIGSVSQRLIRGARCSVLVAPPENGPSYLDEMPAVTNRFAAYEWAERLEEFTRRNVGRTATIEVIDLEIGAQIEEKGFPFVGASFDPRDGRVHIMMGGLSGSPSRHLTRSIAGITAIQVLRDRSGRDMLLRVAHGKGQTLLTLER